MKNEPDFVCHCLFEQSGTFKNEFEKLGFKAFDYDISNDFGQTDFVVDLFNEINCASLNLSSIFDTFKPGDLIFAFFPCTKFSCQFFVQCSCVAPQYSKYSLSDKLHHSLSCVESTLEYYKLLCNLVLVCNRLNLKLVIENPFTQPHFLTLFFPFKPDVVDRDRRLDGDFFKKPTQYFFFGFKPHDNLVFESIPFSDSFNIVHCHGIDRSLISSIYASRFIRRYIL